MRDTPTPLLAAAALLAVSLTAAAGTGIADDAEMIAIPAGEFVIGSNKKDESTQGKEFGTLKAWYLDEHPQHQQKLDAFLIDKYEVTNAQYRRFVASGNNPPVYWVETGYVVSMKPEKLDAIDVEKLRHLVAEVFRLDIDARAMDKPQLIAAIKKHFADMDKLPVVNVSWSDADAYCRAVGKRLPREAEWEAAARGNQGNEFPWGNEWAPGKSNTGDQEWPMGVAPVGSYPDDKSVFGVYDLAGNVAEWTGDWYQAYPGSDYTSDDFGQKLRVVRGAAWGGSGHYALHLYQRGAYRFDLPPDFAKEDLGFRCAKDAKAKDKPHA